MDQPTETYISELSSIKRQLSSLLEYYGVTASHELSDYTRQFYDLIEEKKKQFQDATAVQ